MEKEMMSPENARSLIEFAAALGSLWWWSTRLYGKHERERLASDAKHAKHKSDLDGVAARGRLANEQMDVRVKALEEEFKVCRARMVTVLMGITTDENDRKFIAWQFKD
jgi:hypothetical protein